MGNAGSRSATRPQPRTSTSPTPPTDKKQQPPQQQLEEDGPARPLSASLALTSPTQADHTTHTTTNQSPPPSLSLMAPAINISVASGSPPPESRQVSPIYSGRAPSPTPSSTGASPAASPAVSPRSNVTRGSSVSSSEERRSTSFFWNMQEKYQHRKMARRQSQLESAGRLGRPCCFTLHSITVHGQFPSSAQVQAEVNVVPEKDQLNENLVPELPAVRTAPRPALRPGQVNLQGQQDVLVFPSVTTTSALAITVFLDGAAIGSVRYPLAEVKATLRPTELRLGPGTTGGASPRARSPTSSLLTRRALSPLSSGGGKPPPSRHLSYSPPVTIPLEATAAGGVDGPPTLHMVWGELTFYDNRTSAVGWVDVLEEGGKAVNQRRLLVATPHSFTFMETPHCLVGHHPTASYALQQVTHVEPGGRSSLLLPEKADSSTAAAAAGVGGGVVNGLVTVSLSCPEKGAREVLFAVDNEENSRRWVQVLKRSSYEAAFGGNSH